MPFKVNHITLIIQDFWNKKIIKNNVKFRNESFMYNFEKAFKKLRKPLQL